MLVKRVVWRMASCRAERFRRLCSAASSSAPSAPTAADSVGDAIPKKIEPSTATTNASGGRRLFSIRVTSPRESVVLSAGAAPGQRQQKTAMAIKKSRTSSKPGTTAAMNNRPTGTPMTSPRMMRTTLGGMIWPSVPDAAMVPVARGDEYPCFNMAGSAMIPMVTTVAPTTPVVAAMSAPTTTTDKANPPRTRPSSNPMVSRRSSDRPVFSKTTPINTNNGTASSVKLVITPQMRKGNRLKKSRPRKIPPKMSATEPSVKATG